MSRSPLLISNHIANLLFELGDGRHVPVSIRYGAADRAIAEVQAWLNDTTTPGAGTGSPTGHNNQHKEQ